MLQTFQLVHIPLPGAVLLSAYGSGGEILSETDASGTTLNEYVFFGGKRIADVPNGSGALYYSEDMLGSSRVVVKSNGTLCYDADFTPFGGERAYTATCSQNYKFEGKERDTETLNDDFGARYYSWRFGRWLSSDWSAVPVAVPYANLTNPQTLNLYSMVADDPESFADLDGHEGFWTTGKTGTQDPDGCRSAWITCSSAEDTPQQTQNDPQKPPPNVQKALDLNQPPDAKEFLVFYSCPDCKYYSKDVQEAVKAHEDQHKSDVLSLNFSGGIAGMELRCRA